MKLPLHKEMTEMIRFIYEYNSVAYSTAMNTGFQTFTVLRDRVQFA